MLSDDTTDLKLAVTWVIPLTSLMIVSVIPMVGDSRILVFMLLFSVYIRLYLPIESKVGSYLKDQSVNMILFLVAWFIYSDLFKPAHPLIGNSLQIGISIAHAAIGALVVVLEKGGKSFALISIVLVAAFPYNLTHEYILSHVYAIIALFCTVYAIEVVSNLMLKKNYPPVLNLLICLPVLRASKWFAGLYFVGVSSIRLFELYYKMDKIVNMSITPLASPTTAVLIEKDITDTPGTPPELDSSGEKPSVEKVEPFPPDGQEIPEPLLPPSTAPKKKPHPPARNKNKTSLSKHEQVLRFAKSRSARNFEFFPRGPTTTKQLGVRSRPGGSMQQTRGIARNSMKKASNGDVKTPGGERTQKKEIIGFGY